MKKIFLSTIILILSALAVCTVSTARAADSDVMPDLSMTDADTVQPDTTVITPDSLLNRALESFKVLKFKKFDGAPQDSINPMAFECYEFSCEAIEAQQPESREWSQAKEVLRDVSKDLLAGAFYFSNIGNKDEMTRYARAFLDISLLDAFKGEEIELDPQTLSMVAYIAASGAYNNKEFERAIDYFRIYLNTGDDKQRESVYLFMTQSCLQAQMWDLGIATAEEGLTVYPGHKHLLLVAMQMCIDGGRGESLQKFLTQALEASPTDKQLLDIQGKLHEDAGEYEQALNVFNTLDEINPNSLSTTKHIGLCYYNLAVGYFNDAINQKDERTAGRMRRKAKNYFASAADKFREVLVTAPTSVPYLRSLGVCYLCLEDKYNFEKINERLKLLKEDPLAEMFMPPPMTYNGNGDPNYQQKGGYLLKDAPSYSTYGHEYITSRLLEWSKKGEFETMEQFETRVNQNTIRQEYAKLKNEAGQKYLEEYSKRLRLNDLTLCPYDANNEVFKIESSYGPIYLRVPMKNGEAEAFKDNFKGIRFTNPKFFIDEDSVRISEITFHTTKGKKYEYNNSRALDYEVPDITIDFASILVSGPDSGSKKSGGNSGYVLVATSDVDKDFIPSTNKRSPKTLALVVANENYKYAAKVPAAYADGQTFSEYCKRTLGIPENNIELCVDATLADIRIAMNRLESKAQAFGSDSEIIVYYAGHGVPDTKTNEAYMLPCDGSPEVMESCYKLTDFYSRLSDLNARSVTVFIDACFSGAIRGNEGKTHSEGKGTRGVVIKTKESAPKGNMFVLTAASGSETALPYAEKHHGLFTYFLLKKLQDTKGNVNLKELYDYVHDEVVRTSNFMFQKPQTPTMMTSGSLADKWKSKKLVQ